MSDELMADIQRSLGRIEQKIDSHVKAFDEHVEMDRRAYETIFTLSKAHAKQRGFMTALGTVGTMLGASAGYLIEKFGLGHH